MDRATVFNRFSKGTSRATGHPAAFSASVIVVLVWAATGPLFHYGDTWQLVINSVTNIVTFWMVFLIQNTQNRDSEAMQLKLDELIRAHEGASSGDTSPQRSLTTLERRRPLGKGSLRGERSVNNLVRHHHVKILFAFHA
jgi:low affinity Fe/Cu permease